MKRRIIACVLCCIVLFSSCGNYRELNKLDIVAGMAVDRLNDGYQVTLELVNKEGALKDELSSSTIVLEGASLPEALDQSRTRFSNQFHFGNMQIIIISKELAKEEIFSELLGCFLRNQGVRETLQLMISSAESAHEILSAKGIDSLVTSYALEDIIKPSQDNRSHTKECSIYNAINILATPGRTLVLPSVQIWQDEDEESYVEVSGLAVFLDGHLERFLSEKDVPLYLCAVNQMKMHEIICTLPDQAGQVTVSVTESKTKRSFEKTKEGIKFCFDIKAIASPSSIPPDINIGDPKEKKMLEQAAAHTLQDDVSELLNENLFGYALDISSMGYDLYLYDESLWTLFQEEMAKESPKVQIEVNVQIEIMNSGYIRNV